MSAIFIILFSLIIILIGNTPVHGAETSVNRVSGVNTGVYLYVKIEGATQGIIQGGVQTPGYLGWIESYQYSHSVYIPINPGSGAITGSKVHTPVIFVKEVDKSTPLLFKSLVHSETLIEVLFRFFNQSNYNYFTVRLEEAKIVSIREFMPNSLNPASYQPLMEEISLVYTKITWTWEEEGIEFADEWGTIGES
ncbi:MAG: type VI secretion system tube protein TssD [Candidatus Hodarchaeales archaeon]